MRDIKFRAWEKQPGMMLYDIIQYLNNWLYSKDYEIMQFTGMFDKNGKPMYESDIVKVTHKEHGWEHIGIIEYENGRFFVSCEGYAPDFVHPGHVYEMIGNIYENETQIKTLSDKIDAEDPHLTKMIMKNY